MLKCFGCGSKVGLHILRKGEKESVGLVCLCEKCAGSEGFVKLQWVEGEDIIDGTDDAESAEATTGEAPSSAGEVSTG
jgi:hypothetical protein